MGRDQRPRCVHLRNEGSLTGPRPGQLVALDTQVLVWGVRSDGTDEQRQRAEWLFRRLTDDKSQAVISAVTVQEYLVPAIQGTETAILTELSARFLIAPFDARCAAISAKLFRNGKPMRGLGKPSGAPGERVKLKVDSLVIASVYSFGARLFCSGDKDCRELAATIMEVEELPTIPSKLFDYVASAPSMRPAALRPAVPSPHASSSKVIVPVNSSSSTRQVAPKKLPLGSSKRPDPRKKK